jgi:hypothetical protein
MADTRSFTVIASNYHINTNLKQENITLIVTFPRNADSGIVEVAIEFQDKPASQINKSIDIVGGRDRRVIKRMPISYCEPIIDIVRNEKPLFVRCDYTPGNRVTSESFEIFTHLEEVGEEES